MISFHVPTEPELLVGDVTTTVVTAAVVAVVVCGPPPAAAKTTLPPGDESVPDGGGGGGSASMLPLRLREKKPPKSLRQLESSLTWVWFKDQRIR